MTMLKDRDSHDRMLDLFLIWSIVAAEGTVTREQLRRRLLDSRDFRERHELDVEDESHVKVFNTRVFRDLASLRGPWPREKGSGKKPVEALRDCPLESLDLDGEEWIRPTGWLPGLWLGLATESGEPDPARVLAFREFLAEVRLAIDPKGPGYVWLEAMERAVAALPYDGPEPRKPEPLVELFTIPQRFVRNPAVLDPGPLQAASWKVLFEALEHRKFRIEIELKQQEKVRIPGQAVTYETRTISPTRLLRFNGRQFVEGVEVKGGQHLVIFPFARIREIRWSGQAIRKEDLAWGRARAPEARLAWGLDGYEREGRRKKPAPQRVVLRFRDAAIGLVEEEPGHEEANLVRETVDGQRTLRYEVTTLVGTHFVRWLRAWGPQVEVLEPASLRDRLRKEVAEMVALYARSAAATTGQEESL